MPKQEAPLESLQSFLPPGSYEPVREFLHQYKVHLTITRARDTLLGDYRHAVDGKNHRISVNGNLNPYGFLITLIHELAHLITFDNHGNRVEPHGKEWKNAYSQLLARFLVKKLFPAELERALLKSVHQPSASSCGEEHLVRILRKYDKQRNACKMIEELKPGQLFKTKDGRVFKRGQQLRKRFKCIEVKTGTVYLFSPVYEVEIVSV